MLTKAQKDRVTKALEQVLEATGENKQDSFSRVNKALKKVADLNVEGQVRSTLEEIAITSEVNYLMGKVALKDGDLENLKHYKKALGWQTRIWESFTGEKLEQTLLLKEEKWNTQN